MTSYSCFDSTVQSFVLAPRRIGKLEIPGQSSNNNKGSTTTTTKTKKKKIVKKKATKTSDTDVTSATITTTADVTEEAASFKLDMTSSFDIDVSVDVSPTSLADDDVTFDIVTVGGIEPPESAGDEVVEVEESTVVLTESAPAPEEVVEAVVAVSDTMKDGEKEERKAAESGVASVTENQKETVEMKAPAETKTEAPPAEKKKEVEVKKTEMENGKAEVKEAEAGERLSCHKQTILSRK